MYSLSSTELSGLTFEEAISELEDVVSCLERGEIALAESVEFYELGVRLKAHCDKLLSEAELRIDKIRLSLDGVASLESLGND